MACCSDFCVCISAAVWSIVQTVLHVWWIRCGRNMISCGFKIRQKLELYLYLTYFYNDDCADIHRRDYEYLKNDTLTDNNFYKVLIPLYANENASVENVMFVYLVFDGLWLVASVALLLGTLVKIKESSVLYFFSPWIVMNILCLTLDLFGAIFFGLKIAKMQYFNNDESLIDLSYAAIMAIVSGRLGVIWISNLVFLILVTKATYLFWKARYEEEPQAANSNERLNNNDKNSSEARIRSWQLFYGPIEQSTHMSYSSTFKELEDYNTHNLCSTVIAQSPCINDVNSELRGQLPWSYTQNASELRNSRKNVVLSDDGDFDEKISKF